MARVIGYVKSFENGIFYVRDSKGYVHPLKAAETINEGDHVYGAYSNDSEAKIVIDVLLNGAGDLVLAGDGALQFNEAFLANIFSHHDAVIHINSLSESLALTAAAGAEMKVAEEKGVITDAAEAGDETAAGEEVTDTERMIDTFAERTGAVTDVATDLRPTSPNSEETTIFPTEVTLLRGIEAVVPGEAEKPGGPETPGEPEIPEEPEVPEISVVPNAPTLDVTLGEVTVVNEGGAFENPKVVYSSIGAGVDYTDDDGKLILDRNELSEVAYNPGNGYGVTSAEERVNEGGKEIDTGMEGSEGLLINLEAEALSVTVALKHTKHDPELAQWEAYDGEGNLVGSGTAALPGHDAVSLVTITPNEESDGAIQYIIFLGTENGYYVQGVESATFESMYQYPLEIIDASVTDFGDILGDVVVTGLPEGAILTHDVYDDMIVPEDGTVTFGSDTDPTSWTMTVSNELPEDTNIVASLTSTEPEGGSATTYVGVYGDNELVGTIGPDSLEGREGNDTLVFDTEDALIDGGAGTDTVILVGDTNIDFDTWESSSLKNIEIIDLTSGDQELTNISLNDVINMTDSNNDIYILGDAGDKVDFLDLNGWVLNSAPVIETINGTNYTFDVYTNSEDPTVMVKVEQAITDTIL